MLLPAAQSLNGGKSTYFGAEIPFDLNTLAGIVSSGGAGSMGVSSFLHARK